MFISLEFCKGFLLVTLCLEATEVEGTVFRGSRLKWFEKRVPVFKGL